MGLPLVVISPLWVVAKGAATLSRAVNGMRDLVWLPVEQYRRDGRIVRGLQRGANSFTTSTAMAFLELTNRMVQTVQVMQPAPFVS